MAEQGERKNALEFQCTGATKELEEKRKNNRAVDSWPKNESGIQQPSANL